MSTLDGNYKFTYHNFIFYIDFNNMVKFWVWLLVFSYQIRKNMNKSREHFTIYPRNKVKGALWNFFIL